jgi:hypothetical protein
VEAPYPFSNGYRQRLKIVQYVCRQ